MSTRWLTLANALTLVRAPLAALVWVAPAEPAWLLGIVGLAGLSDLLDGRLARAVRRRRLARGEDPGDVGSAGATGAWLDPVFDKLFVLSVVIAVGAAYPVSPVDLVLIAAREIVLLPLAAAYVIAVAARRRHRHLDFRAGRLGKAATVAQFAAVAAIVLYPRATSALAVGAGIVGLAASVVYLRRVMAALRADDTGGTP